MYTHVCQYIQYMHIWIDFKTCKCSNMYTHVCQYIQYMHIWIDFKTYKCSNMYTHVCTCMQYMHIWIDFNTLHVAHMYHSYIHIHANIALNKQHMHFLRTCWMYVLLHVFACIFVCICIYVVFFLVIFVCMCIYCLYVGYIDRLTLLPAKNTGKYMQYNTEHKNMHIICTSYIHIHAHTYTQKHQIHTRYRTYGLIYRMYLACMLYV